MPSIVPPRLPHVWNKVFSGTFPRGDYFVATILGYIFLGGLTLVMGRIAARAATGLESVPEAPFVLAYWIASAFHAAFLFWCMVRRLHHSGQTAKGAVWWLAITSALSAGAVTYEADLSNAGLLVTGGFWLVIGLLKPKPEEYVYAPIQERERQTQRTD